VDFETVFTCVAGPRDSRRSSGYFSVPKPIVADFSQWHGGELLEGRLRARTMNGHLRISVAGEFDHGLKLVEVADMLEILLLIGGVYADEYVVIGDLVDQDIVYKTAVLV